MTDLGTRPALQVLRPASAVLKPLVEARLRAELTAELGGAEF